MHLSVSQEKLNEEIGDEYRRDQLSAKIRDTENLISESEKKIAACELKYSALLKNFKITMILLLVVVGIFAYIAANAALIAYRFVAQTYLFIIVGAVVVSFIAYVIRRAAKEIPMYVHCRQEEKGTSQDTSNYVYRIKQEKRHLAEYKAELEKVKRELNEIVD